MASHSSAPPSSPFTLCTPIPRAEGIHEELAWEAEEFLGCVTSCCAVLSLRMTVPMFVPQGLSPRPGGVTTGVSISPGMATGSTGSTGSIGMPIPPAFSWDSSSCCETWINQLIGLNLHGNSSWAFIHWIGASRCPTHQFLINWK